MRYKTASAVMKRELAAYFSGPVAYITISVFLLFSGFFFFKDFFYFRQAEMRNFFQLLPLLFTVFIPAMTMRLFAEERQSGSVEMLLTMPVTAAEAVAGKFLAGVLFAAAALVPTLLYLMTVVFVGNPDPGPIAGGYIGALFLGASCTAIGVFTSACSGNQITAFITGLALNFAFWLISRITIFLPAKLRFLEYLGTGFHFQNIAKGLLDIRDFIYFLSVTVIFLVFAAKALDERRNRI